jgi:hypothetical protein
MCVPSPLVASVITATSIIVPKRLALHVQSKEVTSIPGLMRLVSERKRS